MEFHRTGIACFLTLLLAPAGASLAAATHSLQDVLRSAEQGLSARLKGEGGTITHVQAGPVDSRLRMPQCASPLQTVIPTTLRDAARMTIGVRCNQPSWTVYVPVAVETEMQVLVLRQAAARNANLAASDVELQTRRMPGMAAAYLTDVAQLERQHLRISVAPGTALTPNLFAPDVMIRRGQRVTLVASAGGIEVRAQGEAIADGTAGGRVRVLNLSSRRIVEGQVQGPDEVRVSL